MRSIEVNGETYKYSVGKTGVKINNIGYFTTEKHGIDIIIDPECDCCGENMSRLYPDEKLETKKAITPAVVRQIILENTMKGI